MIVRGLRFCMMRILWCVKQSYQIELLTDAADSLFHAWSIPLVLWKIATAIKPQLPPQSGLKNKNYVCFQTNVEQNLTILYQFKSLINTCHNIQRIIYTESDQEDREGSVYNGGNTSNYGCGIRLKMITSGGNGNLFNMFISI